VAAVTARWCGPEGGDSQVNVIVPERGGDVDGGGGGRGGGGLVRSAALKVKEQWDYDGGEGGGAGR
jgi:hypothetical protein